ncbi:DNA-binding protein [Escherichia coli]|nr:DNA-binding protein [Escherichia coli]
METVFDALKAMGKATSVELAARLISVVKKC